MYKYHKDNIELGTTFFKLFAPAGFIAEFFVQPLSGDIIWSVLKFTMAADENCLFTLDFRCCQKR